MREIGSRLAARLASNSPTTWAKLGGGLLLGGLAIGWIAFPYLLDKAVAWQINLAEGKDSRKLWVRLPPIDFNLYLFNITNPNEVMRGAKPAIQEIGPYCYKEVKDKLDLVEDATTDTISYSPRTTWYENQKDPKCKAPQLTGEELLVVPNGALMAILLLAQRDFPPALLTLVNQALPSIFGPLTDVFSRVSARRLLFDGIPIDCRATGLAPRAVCIALKQNSRPLKKLGKNRYSFSYFGPKNHTPEDFRYTVRRGTQDALQTGKLVALDGKGELPFWRGECNRLQGTDGTVFPPFRKMENGSLAAYSGEICRTIFGSFEGVYDYKGVTGYAYSGSLGDTENNPGDRCYCESDTKCRKKGVLDSLKCQGAPLVASQPHFFQANEEYVNGVIGLRPNKEDHGTTLVLEPISGSPLMLCKRIQFNIDLKPIQYVPLTQKLPRTLVPLFWAEESFSLDNDLMGMLEASLFRPIRAVDVLKWGSVTAGVALAAGAVALHVRRSRRDKVRALSAGEAGGDGNDGQALQKKEVFEDKNKNPTPIKSQAGFVIGNGTNGSGKPVDASAMASDFVRPPQHQAADVKNAQMNGQYFQPYSISLPLTYHGPNNEHFESPKVMDGIIKMEEDKYYDLAGADIELKSKIIQPADKKDYLPPYDVSLIDHASIENKMSTLSSKQCDSFKPDGVKEYFEHITHFTPKDHKEPLSTPISAWANTIGDNFENNMDISNELHKNEEEIETVENDLKLFKNEILKLKYKE